MLMCIHGKALPRAPNRLCMLLQAMGIQRYIFFSIHNAERHPEVPLMQVKTCTERYIQQSGLDYTIFRLCGFMQAWPPQPDLGQIDWLINKSTCKTTMQHFHALSIWACASAPRLSTGVIKSSIILEVLCLTYWRSRAWPAQQCQNRRHADAQAIIGNYAVPVLEEKQVWGTSDDTRTAYLDSQVLPAFLCHFTGLLPFHHKISPSASIFGCSTSGNTLKWPSMLLRCLLDALPIASFR